MRKCKYRNCNNNILNGRIDKIYCSDQCKNCEKMYRKRKRIKDRFTEGGNKS